MISLPAWAFIALLTLALIGAAAILLVAYAVYRMETAPLDDLFSNPYDHA